MTIPGAGAMGLGAIAGACGWGAGAGGTVCEFVVPLAGAGGWTVGKGKEIAIVVTNHEARRVDSSKRCGRQMTENSLRSRWTARELNS